MEKYGKIWKNMEKYGKYEKIWEIKIEFHFVT